MIKKLVKHGNSLALIIDKPILELLKIDADTALELSSDGNALTIQPFREADRAEQVRAIHERLNERYAKTFRRLSE